jgi:hypothetical protein
MKYKVTLELRNRYKEILSGTTMDKSVIGSKTAQWGRLKNLRQYAARVAWIRKWTQDHAPIGQCQAVFVALIFATDYQNFYQHFYYFFLLAPFLLVLSLQDLSSLSGSWVLRFCLGYLASLWLGLLWTPGMDGRSLIRFGQHLLSSFAFVAMTAWLVYRDERHILRMSRWMSWSALITALVSLMIFYTGPHVDRRFTAWLWPNPNAAGLVFGLAAVASASGALTAAHRSRERTLYLVISTVLLACVALSQSRAPLVAIMASALACVALTRSPQAALGLIGCSLLVAVLVAFGWISPVDWLRRADAGRFELWSHFWSLSWQHPWRGNGVAPGLAFTIKNGLSTDNPHNMLLETFERSGLPGAISWLGIAVAALLAGLSYWRIAAGLAPLALVVYLLTHGLFESLTPVGTADFFWVYLWIPIGLSAGVEIRSTRVRGRVARPDSGLARSP